MSSGSGNCKCDCHQRHCNLCCDLIPIQETRDDTFEIFILIPYCVIIVLILTIIICALFGNESCLSVLKAFGHRYL